MKKLTFLFTGIILIFTQACAQTSIKVPAKVKAAFYQKFPNAKKTAWDKENATEWEVEFKLNGEEYSANYTSEGIWKETEHEISKSKLPDAVKSTLDNEFKEFDIDESEVSETAKGVVYEFALENDIKNLEVAISPEGKVIKKEVKKNNDEDRDADNEDND
ncbi:MAG: PepSY-like domain-containing protein [Lutibacter sp.]|uniref:PepSY-like domain-containing protein n=1 Tax=Lutibacter sp. TaxID=1925666 RepID=UPI00299F4D27|nr:PepSY-like domain-containing protein [Lutibacter sp.]MDX1828373.1 PepSY-like domain-containing protein [Lutibacter sp.]